MSKHVVVTVLGTVIVLIAGGCSGETNSSSTSSTGSAEGLWAGSTNTNRALTAAVLDDGTYYLFYSAVANTLQIAGVIQGTGTSNTNGTFSSSNTKDFGIGVSALDATLSANFGARQFLNGTINYSGGGTVTFTSAYNTAYDTAPTVASFAGVYQGQAGSSGGLQTATVTVATDGTFKGNEQNGCTFTGQVTLRTRETSSIRASSSEGHRVFSPAIPSKGSYISIFRPAAFIRRLRTIVGRMPRSFSARRLFDARQIPRRTELPMSPSDRSRPIT